MACVLIRLIMEWSSLVGLNKRRRLRFGLISEPMRIERVERGRFVAFPKAKREPGWGLHWGAIRLMNGALVFQFSEN